uniref:Secreted protein n=1 Tax=Romanomermis culicivorax TaxID=13658 RepID=A0A915HV95_ROMCU
MMFTFRLACFLVVMSVVAEKTNGYRLHCRCFGNAIVTVPVENEEFRNSLSTVALTNSLCNKICIQHGHKPVSSCQPDESKPHMPNPLWKNSKFLGKISAYLSPQLEKATGRC